MYILQGEEFNNLIKREFTKDVRKADSAGVLPHVFSCQAQNLRTADFDLLKFSGSFQRDTQVVNFQDTTHVSMHFQLSGASGANISGIKKNQPMRKGQFNVINCINPTSSFFFPAQQDYRYLCVGLKTSFFNQVLAECGTSYHGLLVQSENMKSFTVFDAAANISHFQMSVLQLLLSPPVADNLKGSYMKSKVKELILLSLNASSTPTDRTRKLLNHTDTDQLNAVKEYLSVNYLSALTLESLCRKFLLNEFKLKMGFKQIFGLTVFRYIHELRMQHAHFLLIDTRLTIGEIAAIVGYTADSAFIRAFKTFYGESPGLLQRLRRVE